MEWYLVLLLFFGALVILLLSGLPVAFCFLMINIVAVIVFWGGETGLVQFIKSIFASVSTFVLVPIPLFILMGEVMFQSGVATRMIDAFDKWLGGLPGRLGLLAVSTGTLFAALSGAAMASVALLGSVLTPEMEKRGYKKAMSLGTIMSSGSLAIMIPPSALAVLLAGLGAFSVGALLVAIIIPGLLLAGFYAGYIIIRCWLQPSIAPPYKVMPTPLSEKIISSLRNVLPLGSIIFLVMGLIFLGVATPSEAAALGCAGTFVLVACYGKLHWDVIKKAIPSTLQVTVMILMIIAGSKAFSQVLSFSGASRGLTEFVAGLDLAPIALLLTMQVVLLAMGTFMESISIMMVTLPIFMPIIHSLGFDPVWFGAIMLLNIEIGTKTPPFGTVLFVMKGVAPPGTTMGNIYRAITPFLTIDLIVMALMVAFPVLSLWLPAAMR